MKQKTGGNKQWKSNTTPLVSHRANIVFPKTQGERETSRQQLTPKVAIAT